MAGPSPSPVQRTRWIVPTQDEREVAALAAALGLSPLAARVLWQRGYRDAVSARGFLSPSLDDLNDPFLLKDMDVAAKRLAHAVHEKESILLYGDYDVDGTTSLVILTKALQLAGAPVRYHVPHRLRDGYGMRAEVIEKATAEGVRLIVSVDTGIRAAEVVRLARQLGMDVIITDHHLPETELPPALAVINPNRPDCPYPEKNLCGAGVAFKLIQALLTELAWKPEKIRRLMESFLKLVAMATVADVVPLAGENRIIVKHGLEGFRTIRNPGLQALMRVAGFKEGDTPTAGQVGFRLAPRLNAAGRMANAEDVIDLFLTDDVTRANALAQQLHELNQDRQQTEGDIVRTVVQECARQPIANDQAALVFSGEEWHRGVVGIVASRLVERYHRPVFVLSEEEGVAQGSGRSIPTFHLLEALESMPELFTKFGGHRQAAGLTLPADRVPEFRERLNAYALQRLTPEDFRPMLEIDARVRFDELTNTSAEQILSLAPFGYANPCPMFLAEKVTVQGEPSIFGEKHLRLRLEQNGRVLTAKAWNFAERQSELRAGTRLNAVITVEDDPYGASRGYANWQVTLRDFAPA